MSVPPQKSRFAGAAVSLPDWLTRAHVAEFLGVDMRTLTWWVWALNEDRRYNEFEIKRRTGGAPRTIRAPIKPIKDFQRSLLPILEAGYTPRPHVHGFVRGRSAVTNALVHRSQRWVLRIDLKDFFPSVHFGRVMGIFRAEPFSFPDEVAVLLAHICCHRRELPQGAPTSPILSNLVCRSLDRELSAVAKSAHCHYSRYADDICFSSGRREFPSELASINNGAVVLATAIRKVVSSNDFVINDDKTRLMPRRQRQRVTGVIVNERLNVPREYTRHLRAALYIWDRYGEDEAKAAFERAMPHRNWPPGKAAPEFRLVVRGQLQHLGQVRGYDRVYQRLATVLAASDPSFTPTAPRVPVAGEVIYATEGPSDPSHIDAALRAMRARGEFNELSFHRVTHKPPKNDAQLWKWLEQSALAQNPSPHVGLFDADSQYAATIGPTGWKHLGNGVVAVALARPPWIADANPFCIEMLYPPEVLQRTDAHGRRLFVRSEFDDSGLSSDGALQMDHPKSTTLVVSHVHPVADADQSLALGKVAFADAVYASRSPFETVEFAGFRPTLERLWRAVAAAQRWCT